VIDDTHFQNTFLARTASKHAERLLNALSPFMKAKGLQRAQMKLKQHLDLIFLKALEIKMLSMIGDSAFTLIWPLSDAAFDGNTMEQAPSQATTTGKLPKHEVKRVMFSLVPGFTIYKRHRKLVDYLGFERGVKGIVEEPKLFTKATVLTL
jgi:hypothetical protein